jgi:hypothetical protein
MKNSLALLAIGLIFGGSLGMFIAAANGITLGDHDHGENATMQTMATHGHKQMLDLADDASAPTVRVVLHPDAVSGWNLEIITSNFTFTPENVNQAPVAGEGHAHIYVNGQKLARVYSPWTHITTLPAGDTVVSATLNANDHSPLSVGGEPLTAQTVIQVQ